MLWAPRPYWSLVCSGSQALCLWHDQRHVCSFSSSLDIDTHRSPSNESFSLPLGRLLPVSWPHAPWRRAWFPCDPFRLWRSQSPHFWLFIYGTRSFFSCFLSLRFDKSFRKVSSGHRGWEHIALTSVIPLWCGCLFSELLWTLLCFEPIFLQETFVFSLRNQNKQIFFLKVLLQKIFYIRLYKF